MKRYLHIYGFKGVKLQYINFPPAQAVAVEAASGPGRPAGSAHWAGLRGGRRRRGTTPPVFIAGGAAGALIVVTDNKARHLVGSTRPSLYVVALRGAIRADWAGPINKITDQSKHLNLRGRRRQLTNSSSESSHATSAVLM